MNSKFGELFVVPKPVKGQHAFFGKDQGLRIRDLIDPTKKMSKSDASGKGVIFLADSPEEARRKIMSAATDSFGEIQYNYKERPGISNHLDILELLGGDKAEYIGQTQYGSLKEAVASLVAVFLESFQLKLKAVDEKKMLLKLESSEASMNETANKTLLRVQKAVGLR
jgi:tryptophanyl-tRNA synthetase